MSKKWKNRSCGGGVPDANVGFRAALEGGADVAIEDNTGVGAAKLTCAQKNEAWWKVIGRYDFYFGSVNTKATMLVAFNTFVAGGIVLKWEDISKAFGGHRIEFFLAGLGLFVAVAASLVSLGFTFWAVSPFLGSPSRPNDFHSLLFFGDVAKFDTPEKYLENVNELDEESLCKDLAYQAHALAGGLTGKFVYLNKAIWWIIFVQLPALAALVLILLSTLAYEALAKASQ